jgi:heme/copper-type cytochrome/quinol oxidase subunit 2
MPIVVEVVEQEEFDRWLAEQRGEVVATEAPALNVASQ